MTNAIPKVFKISAPVKAHEKAKDKKTFWQTLGVATQKEMGKITVQFEAFPLDGFCTVSLGQNDSYEFADAYKAVVHRLGDAENTLTVGTAFISEDKKRLYLNLNCIPVNSVFTLIPADGRLTP